MAQKFKLDDLQDFVKIKFLDKNMTFDTVCVLALSHHNKTGLDRHFI